jgi:hypothetical protein
MNSELDQNEGDQFKNSEFLFLRELKRQFEILNADNEAVVSQNPRGSPQTPWEISVCAAVGAEDTGKCWQKLSRQMFLNPDSSSLNTCAAVAGNQPPSSLRSFVEKRLA